jgi:hypothetical protein
MVYVEIRIKLERQRVAEALEVWGSRGAKWDEENMPKLGAKLVGCWHTEYGAKQGEITFLMAYPTLETREELIEVIKRDTAFSKWIKEEWRAKYAANARIRVLRPAAFSPLQ